MLVRAHFFDTGKATKAFCFDCMQIVCSLEVDHTIQLMSCTFFPSLASLQAVSNPSV